MASKVVKILKNGRVILLILALLISLFAINPSFFSSGVAIKSVEKDSAANVGGIVNPTHNLPLTKLERIKSIEIGNDVFEINEVTDYYEVVEGLVAEQVLFVNTNKDSYRVRVESLIETVQTGNRVEIEVPLIVDGTPVKENVTKFVNETIFDEQGNSIIVPREVVEEKNVMTTELVNETVDNVIGVKDIGIYVSETASTNLVKGIDLAGGARVLLKPEYEISEDEFDTLKSGMEKRLNVFGLSDISVRVVRDAPSFLGGKPEFIVVEIPGANENEVKDLISKQGKFEAKIANETVFVGGKDITYVCKTADCSGIDPQSCGLNGDQYSCRFDFQISITSEAAKRQAAMTKELTVISEGGSRYLSEDLELYLDDVRVSTLKIGDTLRGSETTQISIGGPGVGRSHDEAISNGLVRMKELQTYLTTGSLPVKLDIVRTDSISPVLGSQFVKNAVSVGLLALIGVASFVLIRYRKLSVAVPMVITLISEVILLLGLAAVIRWNLDLAAIAGLIIAVGTGVDHLVIITDEILSGAKEKYVNFKERFKNAFFIIMAAYMTTLVAMFPLMFAGAGLLKGFAFTTIAGVSFGVFIARPAYARMLEILQDEN